MAVKLAGAGKRGDTIGKSPKSDTPKKKPADDGPRAGNMGHNIAEIKKRGEEYFKKLFALQETQDEAAAQSRSDFKELYREAAKKLGTSAKVVKDEYGRMLQNKRWQAKQDEREAKEREDSEKLRSGLAGTQYDFFIDRPRPKLKVVE